MRTSELFHRKTVFSFEIFPPKKTASVATVYHTLSELRGLSPDFISVTYGAAGRGSNLTVKIASDVKSRYGIESVAHLPCLYLTKAEVLETLRDLKKNGIENILALRGDVSPDAAPKTDFRHASDLVAFIREHGSFNIIGACYPEGHPEAGGIAEDIRNLKTKVDAGTDQLISQLFFDNNFFYAFLERARAAGIRVPVQAGIMPVTNKKQIERMAALCGAALPKKFRRAMEKYENDPTAMRDAGIAYAIDQIVDLIARGVDGIHLYTMNNSYVAAKISGAVASLLQTDKITA